MSPPKRVYMACDVANLWKSCREQFGKGARVDFQVLSEVVPDLLEDEGSIEQQLVAYIVTNPKQGHSRFEAALVDFGYDVHERFMHHEKGFGALCTDWDVGMAIDAIDKAPDYDLYVLVSGDGDFSMLLDYLKDVLKKETMVLSFRHSLSASLHKSADSVYYFNSDIIFQDAYPVEDAS